MTICRLGNMTVEELGDTGRLKSAGDFFAGDLSGEAERRSMISPGTYPGLT